MTHSIHPQGYRLLVKADAIDETYGETGLVVVEDKRQTKAAVNRATVVEVGSLAFTGFSKTEPWCKAGDRIIFSQYAGKYLEDPATGEEFVILNDEDVIATISKES